MSKVIEKNKEKNLSDTIKLFDFDQAAEVSKSFLENQDSGTALEQPKIYLNILYHDKVVPPLLKSREYADPKNDGGWAIIPTSFGPSKERWSGSGMKCIHVDAHVNTCVYELFKTSPKKIEAITNYILQTFQQMLKEHYVFHKPSIKIVKNKKYKAWRGSNDTIADYVLEEAYHTDHFEKWMKKLKEQVGGK